MDRDEIIRLLTILGQRLTARGLTGEMYVVGGAPVALAFDERRATRDIDAVFEPKATIHAEAETMADQLGLDTGWLNDAVKGFLAGPDPEASQVLKVAGLRVSAASPAMLLALKVLAHRAGEDEDDVRLLASLLGLTAADQVLDLAASVFGDRLDPATQFFVEEAMAS